MFEALSWRKPPFTEVAVKHAADSLAHAKHPIVLGSLAAVALLGMAARVGMSRSWFNHGWFNRQWSALNGAAFGRSRSTVIAARARTNNGRAMPATRNGRRGRRKKKSTT
jgi:hypothetical protein